VKKNLISLSLLFSSFLSANYIYENNQALFDLTTQADATNLNAGDDQLSSAFNLDFTFNFYGETFTSARMATNGCLHFGLGTGNINYNNYCGDYTPDPLPQYDNTLFPFWTDLIRDNDSKMLAKNFSDKAVFGWYDLREFNRSGSDNSFEVVLWTNSTFDYRYGELDINRHDVLIGEQKDTNNYYQYLFYDECNTGTTNSSACVSVDWNNSIINSTLENGGSLYGDGAGNTLDCSNPLNDTSCPGYWEAFDDQQCALDPQYAPFCPGYRFEQDISYFVMEEEFDYGFVDEQELMATGTFIEEPEVFFYEEEVFFEPIFVEETFFEPVFIESPFRQEEIFLDPLPELYPELPVELVALNPFEQPFELSLRIEEEPIREEIIEEIFVEEFEELEEYFEPEFEEIEEVIVEVREEIEEVAEVEVEAVAIGKIDEESGITQTQLDVVAQTISTAANSVSGTTAGTDVHSTGGSTGSQTSVDSNFNLNISTMDSTMSVAQVETETTTVTTATVTDTSTSVEETGTMDLEVRSEADTITDEIVAQNLQEQAQEVIEERVTSDNEYGNEDKLISFINFVPGFDNYRNAVIPDNMSWYAPKALYTDSKILDNDLGYTKLFDANYQNLVKIKATQPNL
tara:strand:- start:1388 stop:3274 length:1887 start_codon:yes stop_codon:yes gene_type:complete